MDNPETDSRNEKEFTYNSPIHENDTLFSGFSYREIIEGGNQFHIKRNTGSLIGYMNAEQCWYAIKEIMTSLLYIERQVD